MENLYNEINELHKKGHNALANASGGVQRNGRGKLVEELVAHIWEGLGEEYETVSQQKHTINFESINKSMNIGCDVDCYKNGELLCIVECKSYCDKCYLERAVSDFRYLNLITKVPKIVVTLEDAIAKNSYEIIKQLHSDIFDGMYILCLGKRSSSRPMYNPQYLKPIDQELFNTLIKFFKKM